MGKYRLRSAEFDESEPSDAGIGSNMRGLRISFYENLLNKARGAYAYTLIDLSHPLPSNTVEKLKEIDGVLRVRVIKGSN